MKRINHHTVYTVTAASTYPVTLAEAKAFLRVDGTADDDLITSLIAGATSQIEAYIGRKLISTTMALKMDGFYSEHRINTIATDCDYPPFNSCADDYIALPYRPISSVTSLKTYAADNTESTLDSAAYRLDGQAGRVYLNDGYTWPSSLRAREAVLITFVAGYGAAAASVPAAIKTALLMHVASLYDCRCGCEINNACAGMLSGFRIMDGAGYGML